MKDIGKMLSPNLDDHARADFCAVSPSHSFRLVSTPSISPPIHYSPIAHSVTTVWLCVSTEVPVSDNANTWHVLFLPPDRFRVSSTSHIQIPLSFRSPHYLAFSIAIAPRYRLYLFVYSLVDRVVKQFIERDRGCAITLLSFFSRFLLIVTSRLGCPVFVDRKRLSQTHIAKIRGFQTFRGW